MFRLLVIPYLLIVVHAHYENETVADFIIKQTSLVDFLLKGYRQELSPLYLRDRYENTSRVANFNMIFTYAKLLEINEPEQYVEAICGSYVRWTDFRLRWNPADWAGIMMIMINRQLLWIPDFMPVDLIDYNELGQSIIQSVVVEHNGSCSLYAMGVMKILCKLNIKEFPFDRQTCDIKIGSSNFLTTEINLTSSLGGQFDIKSLGNGAWQTTSIGIDTETYRNTIYGWEYPRVVFHWTIKRSSTYYVVMIILPSLILTTLTVLAMFWSKINEYTYLQKLTLGFSAFLSQTMLLQITTQNMPKTSHLPALSVFILWNLIVLTSSIICVLVTAKYFRYRSLRPHSETKNRAILLWRRCLDKAHLLYMVAFLLAIAVNLLILLT